MIFVGTYLNVVDNSGALRAICIHLYKKKKAGMGDIILVSLRSVRPFRKVDRGQIFKALVVRSGSFFFYKGNHSIICSTNCVILIKKNNDIFGSRFKGPVFHRLLDQNFSKVLSLSVNIY